MTRPRTSSRAGGFTLLEVLAVVVILSVAASVTLVGLSSAGDEVAMRGTRSSLKELDAKARLYARTGQGAVLRVDDSGAIEVLALGPEGGRIARAFINPQIQVTLEVIDSAEPGIRFDRLGKSPDYGVVLESATRKESWHVCGSSGWFSKENIP